jgi:hypothetical protein
LAAETDRAGLAGIVEEKEKTNRNQMRRTGEADEAESDSGLLLRANAETVRKAKSDLDECGRTIAGKIEIPADFARATESRGPLRGFAGKAQGSSRARQFR